MTESSAIASDRDGESALQTSSPQFYAALLMTDITGRSIERDILRETTLIGSGRGCDVRLKSEDIAAAHCILSLDGGTLRVRDLGSRAGTMLNGERIRTATLSDGDELKLGRHHLRIETNLLGQSFRGFFLDLYHVTEVLGSGGMCWIYGGRNSVSRERVALKVLPSQHSPRMLAHFGIEARAALKLNHPNIIHIQKIVQAESLYFLVMEYLEAISLQELIEGQGALPWRQVCSIAEQLARGLSHVHERGVVHRDVKPGNVLCLRDGRVKLIDFGLAMLADDHEQEKLSRLYARQILGTADYISPEQSRLSSDVDGRSDLYSLGCTMFYALSGRVPFHVSPVRDKIKAQRHQAPPDLREIVPDVPEPVAAIVARLMAKTREERFASGNELAEALAPYATQAPVSFDWQALLSVRVAAAHRRLAKLLNRRRQHAAEAAPQAEVVLDDTAEVTGRAPTRPTRLIEADFLEYLQDGKSGDVSGRADWGELFEIWTQLSSEQRQQLLGLAREMEQPAAKEAAARPS